MLGLTPLTLWKCLNESNNRPQSPIPGLKEMTEEMSLKRYLGRQGSRVKNKVAKPEGFRDLTRVSQLPCGLAGDSSLVLLVPDFLTLLFI